MGWKSRRPCCVLVILIEEGGEKNYSRQHTVTCYGTIKGGGKTKMWNRNIEIWLQFFSSLAQMASNVHRIHCWARKQNIVTALGAEMSRASINQNGLRHFQGFDK